MAGAIRMAYRCCKDYTRFTQLDKAWSAFLLSLFARLSQMPENLKHPEREELWRLATGALPERESERLAVHLKHCQRCAELFDSFSLGMDPLVARIRGNAPNDPEASATVSLGPFFKQVSEKSDIESAADITPGSSSIKDSDPTDDVAEATVDYPTQPSPTGSFAGAPESWPKADHSATITFDYASTSDRSSVTDLLSGSVRQGSRYTIESEIARGGMGAVVRAVDCDIRREVAIKYMLDDSDQGRKARFVEEAQITGQLEHPNIVPIHELGLDADKRLFFAMKLVNGRSLGQIVNELRKQPATAEKTWPLSRLLNIFVSICHALAYAHSRGVIHRDLKPANIMVGDFGEVYVMDWG